MGTDTNSLNGLADKSAYQEALLGALNHSAAEQLLVRESLAAICQWLDEASNAMAEAQSNKNGNKITDQVPSKVEKAG